MKSNVAVLGLCALAAVVYTFPVALRPGTTFPAGLDVFMFLWNNWWIHHAIVELGQSPLSTHWILTPFLVDLRLHTFALLYGLMALPIVGLLGTVATLNLQMLATPVLNGYAAWRLTNDLTRRPGAAAVTAFLVAATPAINFHLAAGRVGCAAIWPGLLALRAFLQLLEQPRPSVSVRLGLWLTASILADQQVTLFTFAWLVLLGLWHLASDPRAVLTRPVGLALAGAAVIVAWPAYLQVWQPFFEIAGYTTPGPDEVFRYSYPLRIFWSPLMAWRVYGTLLPLALAGGLVLWRRVPQARPWALGALLFIVLSLGPVVVGTEVPMPFALASHLPGLSQFRTPYRFQIPAALGLAIVAGILIASAVDRIGRARGRALVAAALAVGFADLTAFHLSQSFPLQTATAADPVYDTIRQDSRDVVVLEVPVGMRFGTDEIGKGEALTFFQPVHLKRLVNGSVGRGPLEELAYYRASPSIMWLANERPPAGDIAADLRQQIDTLSIGYVVVHRDMMDEVRFQETVDVLSGVEGLEPMDSGGSTRAFRVSP